MPLYNTVGSWKSLSRRCGKGGSFARGRRFPQEPLATQRDRRRRLAARQLELGRRRRALVASARLGQDTQGDDVASRLDQCGRDSRRAVDPALVERAHDGAVEPGRVGLPDARDVQAQLLAGPVLRDVHFLAEPDDAVKGRHVGLAALRGERDPPPAGRVAFGLEPALMRAGVVLLPPSLDHALEVRLADLVLADPGSQRVGATPGRASTPARPGAWTASTRT